MTTRAKLGFVLVALGAAVVGLAMYDIMSFAGCDAATRPESLCAEPGGAVIGLLIGGILGSVIAGVATGVGLFITPFLFLGVGVGSIAGGLSAEASGGRVFPLVFGVGFVLLELGLLSIPLLARRRKRKAAHLMATGRKGVATVIRLVDTGVTVNTSIRVRVTYSIALLDGTPAYDAQKASMFPRINLPETGARFPVWVDAADPQIFAVGVPETEEARQMARDEFGIEPPGSDAPTAPTTAAPQEGSATRAVKEIQRLSELRQSGALTDAEFETLKAKLISDAISPE
jgi:Short C-terminal domain